MKRIGLHLAAALLASGVPRTEAVDAPPDPGPPREIGLDGGETDLLPPPARPAGPTLLESPVAPVKAPPPDAEVRQRMRAAAGPDAAASGEAKAWLADVPPRRLLSNALWALRDREPQVRLGGVAALRAMGRPEAVQPIASRVLYESDAGVRRAMAEALGELPDPRGEADASLRSKILTGDRATRIRTAEVMGWTRKRGFVEVLVTTYRKITGRSNRAHIFVGTQGRYIDDFDVQVTAGAFALDPHIGTLQHGCMLETMVIKIEEEWQEIERRYVLDALASISGIDARQDPAAWDRWLKDHPDAAGNAASGPGPVVTLRAPPVATASSPLRLAPPSDVNGLAPEPGH